MTRRNDDDAAQTLAGAAAFGNGQRYDPNATDTWRNGWIAASEAAAASFAINSRLIDAAPQITAALEQSLVALRRANSHKQTPGERNHIAATCKDVERVLAALRAKPPGKSRRGAAAAA
jgi:hypothetical protein